MSSRLVALHKIRFPEFNCNMIIDEHPALIIDSMSLHYNIIFGADYLDTCEINLDYDNNLVGWMEYNIPLVKPLNLFHTTTTPHYRVRLRLVLKMTALKMSM